MIDAFCRWRPAPARAHEQAVVAATACCGARPLEKDWLLRIQTTSGWVDLSDAGFPNCSMSYYAFCGKFSSGTNLRLGWAFKHEHSSAFWL